MKWGTIFIPFLLAGMGCHWVLPFENNKPDGGTGTDAPLAVDASGDGLDAAEPGTDSQPETGPRFDLGGAVCNGLHVSPTKRQVSSKEQAPATDPSIVAIDDIFYVAFVEGTSVRLRKIDPFSDNPEPIITFSSPPDQALAPQIVYNPDADKLAVAWHEMTGQSECASRLMIRETTTDWAMDLVCDLTGTSYGSYGYGPVSLTYDGRAEKEYVLASPVALNCAGHIKPLVHWVPSGTCNPPPSAYAGSFNPLSATYHPILVITDLESSPYQLVRLVGPDSVVEPAELNLLLHRFENGTWSGFIVELSTGGALLNRPAMVSTRNGVMVAWITTSHNLRVNGVGPTPLEITVMDPSMTEKPVLGQDPALAHRASGNITLLAYSRTAGADIGASDIFLGMLGAAGLKQHLPLRAVAQKAAHNPRKPAVAASKNGFGVVWVDDSAGPSEVYFKWVGCTP